MTVETALVLAGTACLALTVLLRRRTRSHGATAPALSCRRCGRLLLAAGSACRTCQPAQPEEAAWYG